MLPWECWLSKLGGITLFVREVLYMYMYNNNIYVEGLCVVDSGSFHILKEDCVGPPHHRVM